MREAIANQGEVRIDRIEELPPCETKPFNDRTGKGWIISHSEQGHHHILGGDCEVIERTTNVPQGMRILYAIVKEPTTLFQDAAVPHQPIHLGPGTYEFRLKREFNSVMNEMRRVMD